MWPWMNTGLRLSFSFLPQPQCPHLHAHHGPRSVVSSLRAWAQSIVRAGSRGLEGKPLLQGLGEELGLEPGVPSCDCSWAMQSVQRFDSSTSVFLK